jgi:glyoxylase-like metal-dependent hydrolase (beta-lactamase superfamily II)
MTRDSSTLMTRRDALGGVLGAGVLAMTGSLLVPGTLRAQAPPAPILPVPSDPRFPSPPSWETELRQIGPNVYAYIQGGGPGRSNVSISNCGVVIGDDGVMVFDTTTAPIQAKALIAAIRKVTDKPFRHVVYSHPHGDHINGGQYFEGAEFISTPYCREEVAKQVATLPAVWEKRDGWAEGNEPRKLIVPTTTFDGKVTYRYGKTVVELFPMAPAHTYGDMVMYLPQEQILFMGDMAFFYVAPFCHNSHPSRWIERCKEIDRMPVRTIVAGHGPLGGKAELADMRGYLELLKAEARRRYDAKLSAGAAAAQIRLGKYDNWIGPERIVMNTARFYQEFSNTLTPDADREAIAQATTDYNAARQARGR